MRIKVRTAQIIIFLTLMGVLPREMLFGQERIFAGLFFPPLIAEDYLAFAFDKPPQEVVHFQPKVQLTEFRLAGTPLKTAADGPLERNIRETKALTLSHRQNVFSIHFSSYDYYVPFSSHYHYLYILEGYDKDWKWAGPNPVVSYSGVPPGAYRFRLKALTNDGYWSEEVSLKIIVTPPWWANKWAYGLYVIGGVTLVYFLVCLQFKRRLLPSRTGQDTTEEEPEMSGLDHTFVQHVHDIILARLDDYGLEVRDIAEAIHLSNSQLHRKLKALTGLSTNHFIRSVRLREACRLLKDPDRSITSIAFDTGFQHPDYFTKVFHRQFNMTPTAYRENRDTMSS